MDLKPVTGELLYGNKGREHLEEEAPCDRLPVDHGQVHKNIYVRVSGGASNPIPLHCKPLPFLPVRVIQ